MARFAYAVMRLPGLVIVGSIRLYQILASPFPSPCRHTPSCSTYALEAVRRYGALKGAWLSVRRIARCQPFFRAGYDPVP